MNNNLKTGIIIKGYLRRLEEAVEQIENELPADMMKTSEPLIGPKIDYFPILENVSRIMDDMGTDYELLLHGFVGDED